VDVWEHAFMVDHRPTERGRYIEAFVANIDWQRVEERFARTATDVGRARPA
jgi:Fe-Mn family superoxide dismutase